MMDLLAPPSANVLQAGIEHHRAGRLAQAVAVYASLVDADPYHADALHLLGLAAHQLGQNEQALALLTRAVNGQTNIAAVHNSQGVVLAALGRSAEAAAAFRQALRLDPACADARANLAHTDPQQAQLQAYQERVDRMRQSPYMDYPAHVHLETMAVCNASCNFCPYPTLERKGATMPLELIEKVLDDLKAIPRELPFQLSPFKVNEPFLDRRLFYVLDLCNDKLPQATLTLTTNASPLTEKKLEQLAEVKNLDYLWVSLNDHRPAEYEATMGLSFGRTLERLEMLADKKTAGKISFRVVLSRVGDGTATDAEFCRWVGERFPQFQSSVFRRGGWLGQVEGTVGEVPDVACTRWFDLSIAATGVVAHCCMDGQAKWPIGDVTRQHVLEIYNAPHYRRLRERTLSRAEAEPCNGCTFL
ncbi:MAG TPA: tetratricopeptide repeat protein [Gemmataceae bacterium]|nr:tetratricopeptide repeat protein [Gemmataceae bacterium]